MSTAAEAKFRRGMGRGEVGRKGSWRMDGVGEANLRIVEARRADSIDYNLLSPSIPFTLNTMWLKKGNFLPYIISE